MLTIKEAKGKEKIMEFGLPVLWLIIFVVLVLFEIATLGLTTIWFAIGALAAFMASIFNANIYVQLTLFVIVSFLFLLTTRPIFKKILTDKKVKTNIDGLIGQLAVVTVPIDNLQCSGAARINGVEWTARSIAPDVKFNEGDLVKVKEINGVKLIVEENI